MTIQQRPPATPVWEGYVHPWPDLSIGDVIEPNTHVPDAGTVMVIIITHDGSRRIVRAAHLNQWPTNWIEEDAGIPILWNRPGVIDQIVHYSGEFLPLLPGKDDPAVSVKEPVNQIPYLFEVEYGGFLLHACTFAHQISSFPFYSDWLSQPASYNWSPSSRTSGGALGKVRVALRYGRALVGEAYRKFHAWEQLDPVTDNEQWKRELAEMRELDALICDICGEDGHWLRDFIRNMGPVSAWDTAMSTVLTDEILGERFTILPKLDRDAEGGWSPIADVKNNIARVGSNDIGFADAAPWKGWISDYARAVERWDTDHRVRLEHSQHRRVE